MCYSIKGYQLGKKKILSHWKAAILEKGLALEIKLGPLFQGLVCPKCSELEANDPQVMILYQFYTIPQMNGPQIFVLQTNLRTYTLW